MTESPDCTESEEMQDCKPVVKSCKIFLLVRHHDIDPNIISREFGVVPSVAFKAGGQTRV